MIRLSKKTSNSYFIIKKLKTRNIFDEYRRNPTRTVYGFEFKKGRSKTQKAFNGGSETKIAKGFWEYVSNKSIDYHFQYIRMNLKKVDYLSKMLYVPDDDFLFKDLWSSYCRNDNGYRDYGKKFRYFLANTLKSFYL